VSWNGISTAPRPEHEAESPIQRIRGDARAPTRLGQGPAQPQHRQPADRQAVRSRPKRVDRRPGGDAVCLAGVQLRLSAPKTGSGSSAPNGSAQIQPSRSDRRPAAGRKGGSLEPWLCHRQLASLRPQARALVAGRWPLGPQSDRVTSRRRPARSISAGPFSASSCWSAFCSGPPSSTVPDQQASRGRARRLLSLPAADPGPQRACCSMSPPTI